MRAAPGVGGMGGLPSRAGVEGARGECGARLRQAGMCRPERAFPMQEYGDFEERLHKRQPVHAAGNFSTLSQKCG